MWVEGFVGRLSIEGIERLPLIRWSRRFVPRTLRQKMFSTFKYVSDPYQDRKNFATATSIRGKRGFLTTPAKSGRGPDITFTKKTYASDPYLDPHKRGRVSGPKEGSKIDRPEFWPTSPSRKLAFSSTHLNHPSVHDPSWRAETISKLREERAQAAKTLRRKALGQDLDSKLSARPILTSPPKRGGYGVVSPGITFSKFPEYTPCEYDSLGRQEWERSQALKKKMGERPAFLSQSVNREFFDAMPHAAASKIYTRDEQALPLRADPAGGMTARDWVKTKKDAMKGTISRHVFRPVQPTKGTFSPFPKRGVEPYDPRTILMAQTIDRRLPMKVNLVGVNEKLAGRPSWRPVSNEKSLPVKSTNKAVSKASFQRACVNSALKK